MGIYAQYGKRSKGRRYAMEKTRSTGTFRAKYNTHTSQRTGEKELVSYAVMTLSVILLSLPVPLSLSGSPIAKGISWATCLVCAALTVFASRRFSSVILVSLVLTFFISYLGDPTIAAAILGTVFFCGLYSASLAAAKGAHLIFVISAPILASGAALALTGSIILSLFPVMLTLPSLALGISSRRLHSRTHSIAIFCAVCIAELVSAVAVYIYTQNGSISRDVIEYAVEYLRGGIEWSLTDSINRVGAVELSDSLILMIREMAAYTVSLLVGVISVVFLTVGYFSQKIECSLFEAYEKEDLLNRSAEPIKASCMTAIVYLIAHVLSFTSGASHAPSFVSVVAENISLILLPVLLCIGFRIMGDLPKKVGFLAIIIWVAAIIIANSLSASILTILALIGAFYIIFVHTDAWAKDHYAKKGEDQ